MAARTSKILRSCLCCKATELRAGDTKKKGLVYPQIDIKRSDRSPWLRFSTHSPDKNNGVRPSGTRVGWLDNVDPLKTAIHEQRPPGLQGPEIPGGRVHEVFVEAVPGAASPAVAVAVFAAFQSGVEGLHDEAATRVEQGGYSVDQGVHGLVAQEGKVADGGVEGLGEAAFRQFFVGHAQVAAGAAVARFPDKVGHGVQAGYRQSFVAQGAGQPAFAAADVQYGDQGFRQYGFDDGGVGDEAAAFDVLLANGAGPGGGVLLPGVQYFGVAEVVHGFRLNRSRRWF